MAPLSVFGLAAFASLACALTYKGADISSVPIVEADGITYTDGGSAKAFENIIVNHGANTARVRVWTSGTYDTAFALAMGKRIKAAGMTLIVDLHYSDTCESILPFTTPKPTLGRGGPWQASDAILLALGPRFSQPLHL